MPIIPNTFEYVLCARCLVKHFPTLLHLIFMMIRRYRCCFLHTIDKMKNPGLKVTYIKDI